MPKGDRRKEERRRGFEDRRARPELEQRFLSKYSRRKTDAISIASQCDGQGQKEEPHANGR